MSKINFNNNPDYGSISTFTPLTSVTSVTSVTPVLVKNNELTDICRDVEINMNEIKDNMYKLERGTEEIRVALIGQDEQLNRISHGADKLNTNIDKASQKTKNILSKLDKSVFPLYFCIIILIIIIIVLIAIIIKTSG